MKEEIATHGDFAKALGEAMIEYFAGGNEGMFTLDLVDAEFWGQNPKAWAVAAGKLFFPRAARNIPEIRLISFPVPAQRGEYQSFFLVRFPRKIWTREAVAALLQLDIQPVSEEELRAFLDHAPQDPAIGTVANPKRKIGEIQVVTDRYGSRRIENDIFEKAHQTHVWFIGKPLTR